MYAEEMLNVLTVLAVLFTISFGYISPGWFAAGCLMLGILFAAKQTQERRRR